MGDAFSVPFILPCLWILKVVSMSVTKPDFFLFFFATRQRNFRQPRSEFVLIYRPKIAI